MDQRLKSYLRPLRRRWGFTQREIAFLIGVKSGTAVSRMEGSKRNPSLSVMLAVAFIFNASLEELFPSLMSEQYEALLRRARELYEQLQGDPSKTTRLKLDFLEKLLARAESESINSRV
jgi:transcriptional regulator with XRE-family HTH domain